MIDSWRSGGNLQSWLTSTIVKKHVPPVWIRPMALQGNMPYLRGHKPGFKFDHPCQLDYAAVSIISICVPIRASPLPIERTLLLLAALCTSVINAHSHFKSLLLTEQRVVSHKPQYRISQCYPDHHLADENFHRSRRWGLLRHCNDQWLVSLLQGENPLQKGL